ncbi:MAG: C25 family cysteine peptidase [Calditrichia bacterium]
MCRRSQGVSVELIDVQDIYDEFNYGIKSPLAIQDFLRYAFFNWSRSDRLKYVLFLGAANLNYKLPAQLRKILVPTFFYQTEKFGAVATDFPYALIAGSDEIPDLFIGRLPVNTASRASQPKLWNMNKVRRKPRGAVRRCSSAEMIAERMNCRASSAHDIRRFARRIPG